MGNVGDSGPLHYMNHLTPLAHWPRQGHDPRNEGIQLAIPCFHCILAEFLETHCAHMGSGATNDSHSFIYYLSLLSLSTTKVCALSSSRILHQVTCSRHQLRCLNTNPKHEHLGFRKCVTITYMSFVQYHTWHLHVDVGHKALLCCCGVSSSI